MPLRASTTGSKFFSPDHIFENKDLLDEVHQHLIKNDFRQAIIAAFELQSNDDYVYHAIASVTLAQVQIAINAGPSHGLHDWYLDDADSPTGHPPATDIAAYISLFDPSKSAANSLKGFQANAKKDSLRASVAQYLTSKRYLDPSITIPKRKAPHANPYIDFWAYSCQALEYTGPNINTANVKTSHHVLPVFMHHFGCACPSYEALEIIKTLSKDRKVIDMGSGNGYWTLMLRRQGCEVVAVDSLQSKWRTLWIDDTVVTDGIQYLKNVRGAKEDVLLMVYPIVSEDFTKKVVKEYQGNVICVVGTQNGNGYTGFKDTRVDEWMAQNKSEFVKIVQIPLPSFAGKDDALFVFKRSQ